MIRKQRLTWFEHVCRFPQSSIVKKVYKSDFDKKRKRGRPQKRWVDQISEDTALPPASLVRGVPLSQVN